MPVHTPICDFGWKAPDFRLPSTDGRMLSFADIAGPKGSLIIFMCNHCPYVLSILDRMIRDAKDLQDIGIGVAGVCANDPVAYPDDSFEKMREMAERQEFPFPYLHDESQEIARAYNAVCTPDFFGFDAGGGLQYRGRLDASGRQPGPTAPRRDLYEAMKQVAETGAGPKEQTPSMGCSIKWKAA